MGTTSRRWFVITIVFVMLAFPLNGCDGGGGDGVDIPEEGAAEDVGSDTITNTESITN